MCRGIWRENRKEGNYLDELVVDGRNKLKRMFKKQEHGVEENIWTEEGRGNGGMKETA